jgi:predicted acyltransferase
MFLFKICSYLELDLTLDLNTRVKLLLVVPIISLSSILSSLLIVSLSGPRRIVLAPDLLLHCVKFLVTGHIRPPNRAYPA